MTKMSSLNCPLHQHFRFDKRVTLIRGTGWGGGWEGRSGWGTHVSPCLIHVHVWQKPLQYCKVISLQLIKINGKKLKSSLSGDSQGSLGRIGLRECARSKTEDNGNTHFQGISLQGEKRKIGRFAVYIKLFGYP